MNGKWLDFRAFGFFLCTVHTNFRQAEQGGGWVGWRGGVDGGWISGLLVFSGAQCTLILDKQSKGVGGWDGGEGREGWMVAGFQGFWFFSGVQCTLILDKQSKGVGGWDGGERREGWVVAQKILISCLE